MLSFTSPELPPRECEQQHSEGVVLLEELRYKSICLGAIYCRLGFNCELRVFLRFAINRFANIKHACILQYGTGLSIAIIGFAIWPDLTRTQLLNYAIKIRPTVALCASRV